MSLIRRAPTSTEQLELTGAVSLQIADAIYVEVLSGQLQEPSLKAGDAITFLGRRPVNLSGHSVVNISYYKD
jgi:hypothetical protein